MSLVTTSSKPAQRIAGLVERTPLIESEIDGRPRLAQMRMPADRRRVQAAGRDQPAAAASRGGAGARRRRFLVGQSRARRGDRRAAARHPRGHRHAGRRAAGEGRRHARRGRRDHLLRPAQRKPRGDRRANLAPRPARRWCRASTIRRSSPGRARVGLEIVEQLRRGRRRRIVVPCGGGGLASGIALAVPGCRDRRSSSPRAGTTWRARSSWARSCRSPPMRRDTCCDALQTPRVSPITFGILRDRERDGAVGQRSGGRRTRCASPGSSTGWWSSRAARSALAALLAGKAGAARRIRWWCCRAGMSIRRFTRGSSASGLSDVAGLVFAGLDDGPGSSARPPWSALRARRRGS